MIALSGMTDKNGSMIKKKGRRVTSLGGGLGAPGGALKPPNVRCISRMKTAEIY